MNSDCVEEFGAQTAQRSVIVQNFSNLILSVTGEVYKAEHA